MSHDLCLYSDLEEFLLVGSPDAEAPGLGRGKIFSGNAGIVVESYEQHCRSLGWDAATWETCANLDISGLPENDCYAEPPEWARPDPVERHLAMINAFLAFAPGAKFGAS